MFFKKVKQNANSLKLESFTQHPRVIKAITELRQAFQDDTNPKPNFDKLIVSDTLDKEGNQYVNLVQEGGGVLGVALVGYTYILEEVGVRFMRLAGTSAGAINTSIMAVIEQKETKKSEKVLEYICGKNLFDFVDGHPFAKWAISNIITNKGFVKRIKKIAKRVFGLLGLLVLVDVLAFGLQHHYMWLSVVARISFVLTGLVLLLCALVFSYINYLFSRFKGCGFGINPGNNFRNWIKEIMEANDVHTIKDLEEKATRLPEGLHLRNGKDDKEALKDLNPDITLITSEIITENKIEFPKMWSLFATDKCNTEKLHPADFVRASMSIPIFFESFIISGIDKKDPAIQKSWEKLLSVDPGNIPDTVRFVDGGVLSNFPINIFYNPEVRIPRLPTWGIDLDDSDPKEHDSKGGFSLGGYLGKIFNTVRFYYDKDFLLKNHLYKKGIGKIRVNDFNWLNFGISDEDKIRLFVRGAEAARDFLLGTKEKPGFNWKEYKEERIRVHDKVNAAAEDKRSALAELGI